MIQAIVIHHKQLDRLRETLASLTEGQHLRIRFYKKHGDSEEIAVVFDPVDSPEAALKENDNDG